MISFSIKVTPKAKRNAITGSIEQPDGTKALKISVTAAPEDNKANDAIIAFIAKEFGTKKKSIAISSGTTSRLKRIEIDSDNVNIRQKLEEFLSA